jgi:hypothetical protein
LASASEEVRELKASGKYRPEQMAELAAFHGVGLIMIYERWFHDFPETWRKLANLHAPAVTAAEGEVSFFITENGSKAVAIEALRKFAATLALPDSITIVDSD